MGHCIVTIILSPYILQCRSILWAVLLSLLSLSAAQCSEKKNEETVFEDLSFFQEDESVIQDDNMESDFQFYEGNEDDLESTNTNLDFAEEMLDEDMPPENDGQIQDYKNVLQGVLTFKCKEGYALRHIKSEYDSTKKDRRWDLDCTPKSVSALYNSPLQPMYACLNWCSNFEG